MTKDELHSELKRDILTLQRRPGDDLDEAELSTRSGLSRTPLREVLQRLAGEGYVELRANRGAQVSAMAHTTLRDFYLVAPMIYGAIHRLAAAHATPVQLKSLRDAQRTCRKRNHAQDPQRRAFANNHFHALVGQMSNNLYLLPSYNRLLIDHARIGVTFFNAYDKTTNKLLSVALDQHDAIIDAIERRDPDSASKLAIDHMNLSRDRIERFVMPDGLDADAGFAHRLKTA